MIASSASDAALPALLCIELRELALQALSLANHDADSPRPPKKTDELSGKKAVLCLRAGRRWTGASG